MKILAVDTSSKICSVAVLEGDEIIIEKHIEDEKTHSQKLMPLIDDVLKSCNLNLKDFTVFSCNVGPGSFTGVRIGVSTVKAFSDVTNIPIVSVNSLESLAYNTINSYFKQDAEIICSMVDAKNDNVYCGIYRRIDNAFVQLGDLYAKNIDEIIDILKKIYSSSSILFVGDGSVKHKYTILQKLNNVTFVVDKLNKQSSVSLGKCAYLKYNEGKYGDSNSLSPLYLRKSQAERALEGEK